MSNTYYLVTLGLKRSNTACNLFYAVLFLSLCPVSLFFSFFTQLVFSKMVPLCKPGPAEGFFLLKGDFLYHCAYLEGSGSGFPPL